MSAPKTQNLPKDICSVLHSNELFQQKRLKRVFVVRCKIILLKKESWRRETQRYMFYVLLLWFPNCCVLPFGASGHIHGPTKAERVKCRVCWENGGFEVQKNMLQCCTVNSKLYKLIANLDHHISLHLYANLNTFLHLRSIYMVLLLL